MYPHRIRLRGPWEVEPLARAGGDDRPVPPAGRMTVPGTWRDAGLDDFRGRVRLRRRFGYPGRLDAHERVWLTLAGVDPAAALAVNGTLAIGPSCDITSLLLPRNELTIDLTVDSADPRAWGEAALEVRALAFLRDVEPCRDADRVVVRGVVAGRVEVPLELYLVADRHPDGYAVVPAGSQDFPFEFSTPARHEDGSAVEAVRVDLVAGAVIWFRFEGDLPPALEPPPQRERQ